MTFDLASGPGNPRNSEGAFMKLKDGRISFIYSRFVGDDWGDHCTADLAEVSTSDGGKTWSEPRIVVKNRFKNVMSVSMLRFPSGRIALFHGCKMNAECYGIPYVTNNKLVCYSDDEGKTWSESRRIYPISTYHVGNNDRMIQLKSGRIIAPTAWHRHKNDGFGRGIIIFYLSDDEGQTWRESRTPIYPDNSIAVGFQEPGVIELKDGSIMCWLRNSSGCQYKAFSHDGGETWTSAVEAPEFPSPTSPLSMKRDPDSGDLVAVWNDYHPDRSVKYTTEGNIWGRTPLVMARSCDEGKTWQDHVVLENSPVHGYCYTAMYFDGGKLFLAYCCGGDGKGTLQDTRIRVVDLKW